MYLKELTINGFKSFAKKSDLEFSAPITAIVGPNGSGKSNVAESFRFVLGEQSVKSLRGKKGEDLIWGGTEKVGRGNRATVVVEFDNSSRTFALDFDEVKIERTVFRDGQNEYKINDSVVRLKDVHELLAAAHIGATGHHIISQGEADRVLRASPKERTAMIEDALGLKIHQTKKQEAEKKLEKTQVNITQVEALRRESAPHLKYLAKQVERAERALATKATLVNAYAEYLRREDAYVSHGQDLIAKLVHDAETAEHEARHALNDAKNTVSELQGRVDPAIANTMSTLRTVEADERMAASVVSQLDGQITLLTTRLKQAPVEPKPLIARAAIETLAEEVERTIEKALARGGETTLARALHDVLHHIKIFFQREAVVLVDTSTQDTETLTQIQKERERAEATLRAATRRVEEVEAELAAHRQAERAHTEAIHEAERTVYKMTEAKRDAEQRLVAVQQERQLLERDRDAFKLELQEAVALLGRDAALYYEYQIVDGDGTILTDEQLCAEDRAVQLERRRTLEKLKIRLEELGIGVTDDVVKEYEAARDHDAFLARELADLEASLATLQNLITELEGKIEAEFRTGIDKIAVEFNSFFTIMFGGGEAKLEVVTLRTKKADGDIDGVEEDSAGVGVELSVKLPNKRVSGLEMLSGGERALTSIAFIFAMSQVNPPPFIILDETDAALDEANSRRYGDMIEALAKKSQLVLITHNRETMSRAGILYGITMGMDGVSKVLSVKFDEAATVAK